MKEGKSGGKATKAEMSYCVGIYNLVSEIFVPPTELFFCEEMKYNQYLVITPVCTNCRYHMIESLTLR